MITTLTAITEAAPARRRGYIDACMAAGRVDGNEIEISDYDAAEISRLYRFDGAGTRLKRMIAAWKITPKAGCSCDAHAAEMDSRGPAWCADNIDKIVGWIMEEAEKRGLPFPRFVVTYAVRSAVRSALFDRAREVK